VKVKATTLLARLQALGVDTEYLRAALRLLIELLMELEISATIDATPYERKSGRKAYRNGYRERKWRTDLGEISLRIPRLRKGTYHPSFMDALPDAEPLLLALVQDAYLQGVTMRSVEDMLRRLGLPAVHTSQIADVCERLDDLVYRFRQRPLRSAYPYLWLDVLKLDVRGSEPVTVALAVGICKSNRRELLGFEVTHQPDGRDFWKAFLRGLKRRGLDGVQIVLSENRDGLQNVVREVFGDIAWDSGRLDAWENSGSDAGTSELVSAISTLLVNTRPAEHTTSPKSMLMDLFGADLVSADALVIVNHALTRPTDAVGVPLAEAGQSAENAESWADSSSLVETPMYQLVQPLAA
jgi:transposase-like protein